MAFSAAAAQDVEPGLDLFTTPAPPSGATTTGTYADFSAIPIPAGFFCSGGPEYTGRMYFKGLPYTSVDFRWRTTDTIIRRLDAAILPAPGSEDTIPIEIVALNLVSVSPVAIPCPFPNELWDVKVCLSSAAAQPEGSMTIRRLDAQGGTFTSTLPVFPKFVFTNLTDFSVKVYDAGLSPIPVTFTGDNGNWVYNPSPALSVVSVPAGLSVDGNCDGALEILPVGTSNFHAGVISSHSVITAWNQGPVVFSVTRVGTEGEGLFQPDAAHPSPNDLFALGNGPFSALQRGGELFQSSGSVLGGAPDMTNVDRMSASWGVGPAPGGPPFMGPFLPSPTGFPQARLAPPPPGTLGLVPADELDALSFGRDGGSILVFSVRHDASGLPGTAVEFHSTLSPAGAVAVGPLPRNSGGNPPGGESGGDLYSSTVFAPFGAANGPPFPAAAAFGSNLLYLDEVDLGLQAPAQQYAALGPEEDELDAVELSDAVIVDSPPDGIPDYGTKLVFISLGPGSPSLTPVFTPDDILVSVPGFLGGFGLYADGVANIGLLPGDDLSSLVLADAGGPDGVLGAGDEALFTLAPGSPSLAAGANPTMPPGPHAPGEVFHTDFVAAPGGITSYAAAAMLGLDDNDAIDALDIGGVWGFIGGGDGFKPMTREQAAWAAHNPQTPQCQIVNGSQCINKDTDGDGIPDDADNSPFRANHLQEDADNDFVANAADNCPNLANQDQADMDGDHVGDSCDDCPQGFNPTQDPRVCGPLTYRLRLKTLNSAGATSVSARFRLKGSLGQESAVDASSSPRFVVQSGFWSFAGAGIVPVILGLTDPTHLFWSGNTPPYALYRSTDCSRVESSLLAIVPGASYTDAANPLPGQVFCYRIRTDVPGS